ncbi:HNH endonuclease [Thermoproteota archaeon]
MRYRKKHKRNRSIPIDKPEECERCKKNSGLEREHIVPLSKGGKDETDNLRYMCIICHDFRHSEDKIFPRIKRFERTDPNGWKLKMWHYRLEVLNKLNPINDKSQEYISYWSERTTHTSYWYYWCVVKKQSKPPI